MRIACRFKVLGLLFLFINSRFLAIGGWVKLGRRFRKISWCRHVGVPRPLRYRKTNRGVCYGHAQEAIVVYVVFDLDRNLPLGAPILVANRMLHANAKRHEAQLRIRVLLAGWIMHHGTQDVGRGYQ
jgi:hypothetical protein